jgi:hypothetical protein
VLGRDLDPVGRQLEDNAAVDDESRHAAVHATARQDREDPSGAGILQNRV